MEAGNLQRRHIARKLRVKDIISSRYVKTEGVNQNYLEVRGNEVSRVNIIGVIVQKSGTENYSGIIIDDGSGRISARTFEGNLFLNTVGVGDIVVLIGRPREYMEEKYLLAEIVKKINPLWAKVRHIELKDYADEKTSDTIDRNNEEVFDESPKNRVIKMIKELDKGEGVSIDDLPTALGNVDQIVNSLLREGSIFEVRPGRLKVLE